MSVCPKGGTALRSGFERSANAILHRATNLTLAVIVFLLAVASADAAQISGIGSGLLSFDPSRGESLAIRFRLSSEAAVRVEIYDTREILIRTLGGGRMSAGSNEIEWDGSDHQGRPVPPHAYRYVIVATDGTGTVRHDSSDTTGGKAVEVLGVDWDSANQMVNYRLNRPSLVYLGVGLAPNGPLLHTLLDWLPRDAGSHGEAWDGLDVSRVVPVGDFPAVEFRTMAKHLSRNSILVLPRSNRVDFVQVRASERQIRPLRSDGSHVLRRRRSMIHEVGKQWAVPIQLSVPPGVERTVDGLPVLSDRTPVRVDIHGPMRDVVVNQRFEVGFYIDGKYVFENEVAFLPTSWVLDPSRLSPGRHYVTSNLWVYEGGTGAASLEFVVARRDPGSESIQAPQPGRRRAEEVHLKRERNQ